MATRHDNARSPRRPGRAGVAVALAAVAAIAACRREEVTHYRVAKEAAPAAAMGGIAARPAADGSDLPAPPKVEGGLRWSLPAGWKDEIAGGMRYATLKPPVAGRVDGSVVVLPGEAGGELANVNRWRGQIGLAPIDEAALASARRVVRTKAGPFSVYDFTSEGQSRSRVVAALATEGGNTWFVKLTGDAGAVAAARADFLRLVESLRFE
jgi:hypothetical protein